jgi:hypothetical protein
MITYVVVGTNILGIPSIANTETGYRLIANLPRRLASRIGHSSWPRHLPTINLQFAVD